MRRLILFVALALLGGACAALALLGGACAEARKGSQGGPRTEPATSASHDAPPA